MASFLHCLIWLVGGIIRGRVLLNGDVKQSIRVPSGAVLLVRLQDTSVADAPSIDVKQIRLTPLFAFPFTFQLSIPTNASRALPYSMSARITKGETLLYINDQYVPITIGTASPISVDIPVIAVGKGKCLLCLVKEDDDRFFQNQRIRRNKHRWALTSSWNGLRWSAERVPTLCSTSRRRAVSRDAFTLVD